MDDLFQMMLEVQNKKELGRVLDCNKKTEQFGLTLSQEEAKLLMKVRKDTLIETQRVEFEEGILPKVIYAFCDSQYIEQKNYVQILSELQEIFYLYKNESENELTDDELLAFMKTQYEEICFGDLEYLSTTCLERFARAIRSGYQSTMQNRLRDEYTLRDTENEYNSLSEETRWEDELYKLKLEDTY
jgi:hypothetical protein